MHAEAVAEARAAAARAEEIAAHAAAATGARPRRVLVVEGIWKKKKAGKKKKKKKKKILWHSSPIVAVREGDPAVVVTASGSGALRASRERRAEGANCANKATSLVQ